MSHLPTLSLVDLVVALAVVLLVVGALRRGAGPLAALASGALGLLGLWLAAVLTVAFAPASLAAAADHSALVQAVPYPHHAIDQARALVGVRPHPRP